jgi:hypothetical protein
MWPKQSNDERVLLRRITIVMAASYPVLVAVCAVINIFLDQVFPGHAQMSWVELIYGPAIAAASVWTLLMLATWIEFRFRRP